jgi:hypothetical protein
VLDSQDVLKCVVLNDLWHVEYGVEDYTIWVKVSDMFSNDSLLFFNEPPTLHLCQNRQVVIPSSELSSLSEEFVEVRLGMKCVSVEYLFRSSVCCFLGDGVVVWG